MSPVLSAALHLPRRDRPRDARIRLGPAAAALVLGGATALAVGYAPIPQLLLLVIVVGIFALLVVFASTAVSAVLLGVALPELQDLTGGHLGLHVAASDLLLVLIGLRLLAESTMRQRSPAVASVRRVGFPLAQYAWMIVLVLLFHLGLSSTLKSVQRLELFALPVFVGAYVAWRGQHVLLLRGYVLACTVLAVAWPVLNAHGLAGQLQKNPTAGFIACAILILLAVRELRAYIWCLPVLLVGLALAESRGALLALAAGVIVIALMRATSGGRGAPIIARLATLALVGIVVYQFLPANVTSRLTNYSVNERTRSSYALAIRDEYARDAEKLIAAHPWTGVGVGNYSAGTFLGGDYTTDPHNVVLLEAAEGGYVFAASFILLIVGLAVALWRMRRVELAAAAAAVLLATFTHGLVDIYWVRGTPVLGFLMVGMVCALASKRQADELAV